MLLYVYKGVTSTDSRKTQIFYPLDLKSNFPHHLMGPTLKVSKLVHAQAYRSQVVPYPSPLSQTLHPEKLVPFLVNPTTPKTTELEPPKTQNRTGKGVGKERLDPLKPHSLGKTHVAGNSVLTSFFL